MINNCHLFLLASWGNSFLQVLSLPLCLLLQQIQAFCCCHQSCCGSGTWARLRLLAASFVIQTGGGLLYSRPSPPAAPHHTCAPDPSPGLLAFSIAPQCLSSSEGPKLNPEFELWPQQCPAQGHCHCPGPTGCAMAGTGHVPLASCPSRQVWLIFSPCQPNSTSLLPSSFQLPWPQPVAAPTPGIVEPHTIGRGTLI